MRLPLIITVVLAPLSAHCDTEVFLPSEQRFVDNEKDIFVKTTIPSDFTSPEEILAGLLSEAGSAADQSLSNPFDPETIRNSSHYKGAKVLRKYFRGVRKEGDVLVLRFSNQAMRYLNNTISIQEYVKGSMERTLRHHFPEISDIHYEVGGKIITEWDA